MSENYNNKRGRPQKYVFWSDWQAWLLKEWYPFRERILNNDLVHMKNDITWLKLLNVGIILAIIGGALAIMLTR